MHCKSDVELARITPADEARFWSKVVPVGECRIWQGAKLPSGYGKFGLHGVVVTAHRMSLAMKLGHPPRHQAIHSCDTPSCVRQSHLRDGTQLENVADAMARTPGASRPPHYRGEGNGWARLTEDNVREIRRRSAAGESGASIARSLGVTKECVYFVLSGRTWSHVH